AAGSAGLLFVLVHLLHHRRGQDERELLQESILEPEGGLARFPARAASAPVDRSGAGAAGARALRRRAALASARAGTRARRAAAGRADVEEGELVSLGAGPPFVAELETLAPAA